MKTARELFEELGYKKICDDVNYIIYNFEEVFEIRFYKPQQDFSVYYKEEIYNTIDIEELQAINQQVNELGWNNANITD